MSSSRTHAIETRQKTQTILSSGHRQMDTDQVAAGPETSIRNSRLMGKAPTLLSLTLRAIERELLLRDDFIAHLKLLPSHILEFITDRLPPLALHRLQCGMPSDIDDDDYGSEGDCVEIEQELTRKGKYEKNWMGFVKLRWSRVYDLVRVHQCDWQQIYWETHLQDCLDEAPESASLPSFNGRLGDIEVSDSLLKYIGCEKCMKQSTSEYTKLYYHCRQFGLYARSLRLHNVFCVPESSQLLRFCKLESLVMLGIESAHVDGLHELLSNNCGSLTSLEFLNCEISSSFANAIYNSLHIGDGEAHKIQNFSIRASVFLEMDSEFAHEFASFLSSGRSLASLKLRDNKLEWDFARMLFITLLNASSTLSVLDLSKNFISYWLSEIGCRCCGLLPSPGECEPLLSLRVLNLRDNLLQAKDAVNLGYALLHLPSLEILDISENPIEDGGISGLIPYFTEDNGRYLRLSELKLDNCCISSDGINELLQTLSSLKRPLTSLSIAKNYGSHLVGATLGRFLSTPILVMNIGRLGLCREGFREMKNALMETLKIVEIDISCNGGGAEAAEFLLNLLSSAPQLVKVDASYNSMPGKSATLICSALEAAEGCVEHLDLTRNFLDCELEAASMFTKFQHNGEPVVTLSSQGRIDDDP